MGGAPSLILKEPELWLGGEDVIVKEGSTFLADKGIRAVLSVCQTVPGPEVALDRRLQIDIVDNSHARLIDHLWTGIMFIQYARVSGMPIYVHCAVGMSRSVSVVIGYLMAHLGVGVDVALAHIVRSRPQAHPNPGFLRQLRQFESQERDMRLHELHTLFDAHALLDNDFSFLFLNAKLALDEHQNRLLAFLTTKTLPNEPIAIGWLRSRLQTENCVIRKRLASDDATVSSKAVDCA